MILQALKEYYDRKAKPVGKSGPADPESGIAPLGWEWKRIPFRGSEYSLLKGVKT